LGLPKLAQEKQLLLDCLFTINRYKLIFDTGACFGSYKELGQQIFRNLEDFANTFLKFLLQQPAVEYP
jgi:hypothetical protein